MPDLVAEAYAALSGETVVEVARLGGNAPVPTWQVSTNVQRVAVRLYPETDRALEATFAHEQATLLEFLGARGFPVPRVVALGLYQRRPLLVQGWLGDMPLAEALQREPQRAEVLGETFGRLHANLHSLPTEGLADVVQLPNQDREEQAVLLHLDFHPFNVLVAGDTLGVIDWENARLGDPRADVARTLSILSINPDLRALPRESKSVLRTLRRAYLRGYCEIAGEGALAGLPSFLAWSAGYMLQDLGRRYDGVGLESVRRWRARWERR